MKHDSVRTFLTAAVLAALTALGGVGCLVTGFSLPVEDPVRLTLLVAAVGTVGSGVKMAALLLTAIFVLRTLSPSGAI